MLLYFFDINNPTTLPDLKDHITYNCYYIAIFGALGALFGGTLAKQKGRRHGMMVADLITVIGSLVCVLSVWRIWLWCNTAGITIMAWSCGMNTVLVPLYIKEMSPLSM